MKFNSLPTHVALIMDGNGRWAEKRLMPRKMGHRAGVKTLLKIAKHAFTRGVKFVTVYAFSTENKFRPKEEVDALIGLIRKNFATTFHKLVENGIAVKVLGDASYFPSDVITLFDEIEKKSASGKNGTLNVALNYGGRAEIVHAFNALKKEDKIITEEDISSALFTGGQPDPDLLIRTGGEKRLSNFLLYQCAYTEFFFTDTLWPDFSAKEFDLILQEYSNRNRRYGKV